MTEEEDPVPSLPSGGRSMSKAWWRRHMAVLWLHREALIIFLSTTLLLPIPILNPSQESRCGYVILLMAIFWMTEALPMAITSLVPVFAFPLLGIMSTDAVCLMYMKETTMMFLGGIMVAIAVEYCRLHERIALKILLLVGQSPRRLMAGFMMATAFLSMWLSNTASTVMLVPIVEAILEQLCSGTSENPENRKLLGESLNISCHQTEMEMVPTNGHSFSPQVSKDHGAQPDPTTSTWPQRAADESDGEEGGSENDRILRKALLSSVMCAANLGGTGVITGTGPNLVLRNMLESMYKEPTGLNFLTWMLFNIPGMVICVFLSWLWLQTYYMGFYCNKKKGNMIETSAEKQAAVRRVVECKYRDLGPMRFQEVVVLTLFIILVFLWLFMASEFIPGWASYFANTYNVTVKSATPVMLIVFLLFVLPAKLDFFCFRRQGDPDRAPGDKNVCLTWEAVQERVPWNVVLLIGGGFSMAEAAKVSGLSSWLGEQLYVFRGVQPGVMVLIVTIIAAMVTEIVSNTGTTLIFLPVLNELAHQVKVNPMYLMLPATVSASYAFMLPVATAPNAIVFSVAKMSSGEMMRIGLVLNVVCVLVINLMVNTLGVAMFDLHNIPAWANSTLH